MTTPQTPPQGFIYRSVPRSVVEALSKSPAGQTADIMRSALREHMRRAFDDEPIKSLLNFIVPASIEYTTKTLPSGRLQKRIAISSTVKERHKFPLVIISDSGVVTKPYLDAVQNGRVVGTTFVYEYQAEEQYTVEIVYAHGDETSCLELRNCLRHIFGGIADVTRTKTIEGNTGQNGRWIVRIPKVIDPGSVSRQNIGEDNIDTYYYGTLSMTVDFECSLLLSLEKGRPIASRHEGFTNALATYQATTLPTVVNLSNPIILVDIPHMPVSIRVISTNPEVLDVSVIDPTLLQLVARKRGTAKLQFLHGNSMTLSDEREIEVKL